MGFYRLTAGRRYAEIRPGAEGVIASEVLPGFQFRWSDLHKLPDLEELALDEVYAAYVIPGFQNAVNRAEAEAVSRRQAEERAERAEERAEGEAVARRQAEERAEAEAAARRQAEEQIQALRAELARKRPRR